MTLEITRHTQNYLRFADLGILAVCAYMDITGIVFAPIMPLWAVRLYIDRTDLCLEIPFR